MKSLNDDGDSSRMQPEISGDRPLTVWLAIAILAAQGVFAFLVLIWYVNAFFTEDYTDLESTLVQILLITIATAWMIGTAVGMYLAKNIAKASAIVVQILFVALGVTFLQSGATGMLFYGSIVALVVAGLAFFVLFSRATTEYFLSDSAY